MALRVANSAVGSAGTDTVSVTDNGSVIGDLIILGIIAPGSAETITWPSGFVQITSANNTGAGNGAPAYIALAWGTTQGASYSMTVQGAGGTTDVGFFASFSSRITSSAPTNFAATSNVTGGASPISIALTGVTALAADDLLWFGAINNQTAGTSTWTAPSGLTSQTTCTLVNATHGFSGNWSTKNNLSAGATGTLTGSDTTTGGNADGLGIVIALPFQNPVAPAVPVGGLPRVQMHYR